MKTQTGDLPGAESRDLSLLFPNGEGSNHRQDAATLDESTVRDLGIDVIARSISSQALPQRDALELLRSPVVSKHIIDFRHDILEDFIENKRLAARFEEILPKIRELFFFNAARSGSDSPVMQSIWRLGELELYVSCMDDVGNILTAEAQHLRSAGLKRLASHLESIRNDELYIGMKRELPKLRKGLKLRKSVTIGVNLDEKLRPVEATLISINERPFTDRSLLGRLFGSHAYRSAYSSFAPLHTTPVAGATYEDGDIPLNPLFQDIEILLRSVAQPLAEALKRYLQVNTAPLRALVTDVAFYLGASKLANRLESMGLPVCKPEMIAPELRETSLEGFYNLQLALRPDADSPKRGSIVLNDLRLDESGRIALLTGPNQGGKTTFTQGVGLAVVLGQCGLFIPAKSARMSPIDIIATHFPVAETGQLRTGRLAEESERLSKLFEHISDESLVLLNESLSSTSPDESLYLAEEIVKALRFLGARCIFATHLHDLARNAGRLNSEVPGDAAIFSLVAGVSEGADDRHPRTYRIIPGPPAGSSFARDIAKRSGIGFEELKERLMKRGVPKRNTTDG